MIDDNLEDDVLKVTVVATGLGGREKVLTRDIRDEKVQIETATETITERRVEEVVTMKPAAQNSPVRSEQAFTHPREYHETPAAPAREEIRVQTTTNDHRSGLAETIKQAANDYKTNAPEESHSTTNEMTEKKEISREGVVSLSRSSSRARSIAEKLGFINFDEEELDTPTYLRNEEVKPARPADL